jgi:uncharacterized OB-fold protein
MSRAHRFWSLLSVGHEPAALGGEEDGDVSDGRCRACGAAVAPNAAWCSLCFADLRPPAPEPQPPPATAREPLREPVSVASAATTPFAPGPPVGPGPAATPVEAAGLIEVDPADPLGMAEPTATPTWPCPRCGHQVAIELDACDACGAGFLSGAASTNAVRLPVVGEVTSMSSSQRLLMAIAVAIVVMGLLVFLAFLGGQIFN